MEGLVLKRKAWSRMQAWKNNPSRKALMITGARQIGKTTLVREFAKQHYECFAELNFLEDPNAQRVFEGARDADTLITNLTAYSRTELKPGHTLVLLDEIQECPAARTAIKFLVEDGRFDYAETGSLLGVRTKEVSSYPVGFEETMRMYPMDFEEFCWANGVQASTIAMLEDHYRNAEPVSESVHGTMMRLFQLYTVVGGMPDAVQRYVDTHDIAQTIDVQTNLLALYRLDIAKYADNKDKAKIRDIFDAIPSQLDDKNRRFILADLRKTARQNRYSSSFLWLADAGVALPCYNVNAPLPPLENNGNRSLFKLFMNDTGLLCAASMDNIQFELLSGNLEVNMGAIAENVVAQELKAHGFALHYFITSRIGEVDFIVRDGKTVMPIEVKSGNDWKRHKALDNLMAVQDWGLENSYVLCKGNVMKGGTTTYLPLYMVMFLKPTPQPATLTYTVDLSALEQ